MPFFSIIIPSYNRRDLIRITLDSVLSQQCTDNEVIVVDDGSTDGTLDVLAAYGSRIRVVEQKNAGPGPARNRGADVASGQYLAFLDSDDVWLPWALATYKQVIDQCGDASIFAARHRDIANTADVAEIPQEALSFQRYLSFFQSPRGWVLPSTIVLKAGTLQAVGGMTGDIRICEDADFWLRLGCQPGFIQILSPVTVGYRLHAGGISQNWHGRASGVEYLIAAEMNGRYPGGIAQRRARRDYICKHARPTSLGCLRHGLIGSAIALFSKTARWNVSLKRFRYLLAFPILAAYNALIRNSQNATSSDLP